KSLEAQRRVTAQTDAPAGDLAEAYSLRGSSIKDQWRVSWKTSPADTKRANALNSGFLMSSYEEYLRAFRHDVNHYYSGLNALAMVTILLKLAQELPEIWQDRIGDEAEASRVTSDHEAQRQRLRGAGERLGRPDRWIAVSQADFKFLTSSRSGPVVRAYEQALSGQPELVAEAVRKQLAVYGELGLFQDRLQRVLDALPAETPVEAPRRTMLFTGHQIYFPGRPEPRFPAEKESVARDAIRAAVEQVRARYPGAIGIAGCASGGGILFHEVCADLEIPTTPYLAVPPEIYVTRSVASAGPEWVQRFWAIQAHT